MKIKVPFLNLGAAYQEIKTEIDAAIFRVTESGEYILGSEVNSFEDEWAEYCNAKHAVGVANGLDALILICVHWMWVKAMRLLFHQILILQHGWLSPQWEQHQSRLNQIQELIILILQRSLLLFRPRLK